MLVVIVLDGLRPDLPSVCAPSADAAWAKYLPLGRTFSQLYAEFPVSLPARRTLCTGRHQFPRSGFVPLGAEATWLDPLKDKRLVGDTAYMLDAKHGFAARFTEVGFVRGQWSDDAPAPGASTAVSEIVARMPVHPSERAKLERYLAHWAAEARPFSARVIDHALARIGGDVLWVDVFDTHEPWLPRGDVSELLARAGVLLPHPDLPPRDESALRALCDRQAREALQEVSRLLDALAPEVAAGRASVCMLSDHGTPLGEHQWRKLAPFVLTPIARCFAWFWGAGIAPGVDERLASNVDFAPTFARLLGHGWEGGLDLLGLEQRKDAYTGWFRGPVIRRAQSRSTLFVPGELALLRSFDRVSDPLELHPQKLAPMDQLSELMAIASFLQRA